MSDLLIKEYPLMVLPSLAKAIGLNEAIVLQQLHYWLKNPKSGVVRNGFKWAYNTYGEWQEDNFPFWSVRTIQRAFLSLEERGFVVTEQLDASRYDQKKYYRIDYDKFGTINDAQLGTPDDDKMARSLDVSETTTETTTDIAPNGAKVDLSIENKIFAGLPITEKDLQRNNQEAEYLDQANLVSMGGEPIFTEYALAFQRTRGISIPNDQVKGARKVCRSLFEMGVKPEHVTEATRTLMNTKDKGGRAFTITKMNHIQDTAIGLANPAPEENSNPLNPQRLEIHL
jgi:hypothetical protein